MEAFVCGMIAVFPYAFDSSKLPLHEVPELSIALTFKDD
jgi:hypothetical protein